MRELARMLDALPKEFLTAYEDIVGTVPTDGRDETILDVPAIWPPSQESLWKMIEGEITVTRSPAGLWYGFAVTGRETERYRNSAGGKRDIEQLECWQLEIIGLQHGFRWTGSAWAKGASDGTDSSKH